MEENVANRSLNLEIFVCIKMSHNNDFEMISDDMSSVSVLVYLLIPFDYI